MATSKRIHPAQLRSTVRFVKGYRYLDRCGEAMVRIEGIDENWVTGESTPTQCTMNNYKLGLKLIANSEFVQVVQSEFISVEHFRDQTCRIYEILWKLFEVERVLSPGIAVKLRMAFESTGEAEKFLRSLNLATFDPGLLRRIGGTPSAIRLVLCTEEQIESDGVPVTRRRRVEAGSVRQMRQPDFDQRVIQRLPLIPIHHRDSMAALLAMRRLHSVEPEHAVDMDLENAHEAELSVKHFDLAGFIDDSVAWAESLKQWLYERRESIK